MLLFADNLVHRPVLDERDSPATVSCRLVRSTETDASQKNQKARNGHSHRTDHSLCDFVRCFPAGHEVARGRNARRESNSRTECGDAQVLTGTAGWAAT
jgi:hypothetical protein